MRKQDPMWKGLLLLLIGLMTVPAVKAQLLTNTPWFPVDTSTVTITVDCSKGNQGLYNYSDTGDIYVHIGVITNLSSSSSDWRYAPFTWGITNPAAHATSLGNNKYQYTISDIRSFFGVPSGENILAIAILFRNGSGSLAQRNADASDMFVQLYSYGALAAKFLQPPFQPKYTPVPETITLAVGGKLPVKFVSDQTANLSLSFNETTVTTASSTDSLTDTLTVTAPGNQQVIARASSGGNTVSDTINFYVGGATTIAALPSGVKEGINYLAGDTSVILVLYAPYKHKVVAVGDFNNWTQDTAYQLYETPDSNYYWRQINGLTSGQEYAYQYVIDDSLQLADYNTEKVLDKSVDPSISATTYPNLKSFPSGASGTLASIIQTGQAAYNWQVTSFQRPDKKNLRIYELWLKDFTTAGNFQGLIDTLSYLKNLGINAVEIMPLCNFEGSVSWGYNPNFYFAPDKVYGTPTALKQLIDACHQQGMAVIMDLVMNHSFGSSPMVQMYWDNSLSVPAANSPWFNQYPTHADNVGYQFNHESAATVTFTKRVINYWLTNYHIDGYRWDLAKGFTQTRTCDSQGNNCDVNAWGAYDAGRVATWDTIYNQMQAASSGSYCILEMFADNSEQQVEANYGMMLWGEDLNTTYNQATMGYSTASPNGSTWDLTGSIYTSLGGWNNPALVVYQESHDDERLMYNNEAYGNSSGSYTIKDTATGLQRDAMATAFWALAPGPKMLNEFGELGFDYSINWCSADSINSNCRTNPKPIRWDYLQDTSRKKLHDVYQKLLTLRANYPDLATGTTAYSLSNAFKYLEVTTSALNAVVVGNFDVVSTTGDLTFPSAGTWYDVLSSQQVTATGGAQSLVLSPGEYHVYLNKNINAVDTTTDTTTNSAGGLSLKLYPNPVVSGTATITYQLPVTGNASLEVYTMTGQRAGVLNLGSQAAGSYTLSAGQFSFLPLGNGYYILKLVSAGGTTHLGFLVVRL